MWREWEEGRVGESGRKNKERVQGKRKDQEIAGGRGSLGESGRKEM